MDKGTLYQLKNVTKRAAEDFLLVVLHAHIITASEKILQEKNITSVAELADSVVAESTLFQPGNNVSELSDGVFVYACDVLTLGLLWMGFHDATKEGDGERVMRYWKALLPIFKASAEKTTVLKL